MLMEVSSLFYKRSETKRKQVQMKLVENRKRKKQTNRKRDRTKQRQKERPTNREENRGKGSRRNKAKQKNNCFIIFVLPRQKT